MAADVITMITTDHRELERLFDLMRKDPGSRPLALPLAVAMLTAHSRAEEEHVYPVVAKEAGEKDEARHGTEEHHEAEELGRALLAEDPESDAFAKGLEKFIDAVLHHVKEEEDDILPALRDAAGPDRLRRLGADFAERRARELTGRDRAAGNGGRTRDELYEQARELDVPGRSAMTKEELAREVRRAGAN